MVAWHDTGDSYIIYRISEVHCYYPSKINDTPRLILSLWIQAEVVQNMILYIDVHKVEPVV